MDNIDYEKWHASDEYRSKLRSVVRTRDNAHVVADRAQELLEKWMLHSEQSEEKAERLAAAMRSLLEDIREFSETWQKNLDITAKTD